MIVTCTDISVLPRRQLPHARVLAPPDYRPIRATTHGVSVAGGDLSERAGGGFCLAIDVATPGGDGAVCADGEAVPRAGVKRFESARGDVELTFVTAAPTDQRTFRL